MFFLRCTFVNFSCTNERVIHDKVSPIVVVTLEVYCVRVILPSDVSVCVDVHPLHTLPCTHLQSHTHTHTYTHAHTPTCTHTHAHTRVMPYR